MHKRAEEVGAAISIPLLHIVDETGEKMRADGVRTAAVIGTRNVMTESWYRQRLVRYVLTTAPFDGARAEEIERNIYDELMQGKVTEGSRRTMRTYITDTAQQHLRAPLLARTQLTLRADPCPESLPIHHAPPLHV